MTSSLARILALFGYLGLLVWVVLWHGWLSPHPEISNTLLLTIWVVPLLFPLWGILLGKPYTHAWANFVLMFYFLHSLTLITTDEGERLLALVELLLATIAFVGCTYYARLRGRELGLGIKKEKQQAK
ncbi:hypothetical protein ATO46_03300 [Aeromonas schubertii]|uniref:DUF2069 domain-containing protein n=1 Tax=Aeromonas schubertii TaxID=652 RepID=UPI00067EE167|nr:DUF2069 domain-containing protein [Aeromonas schubertii]KUE80186.1 hypothetical protein ATO46_03300 [Aeromonas schubertii]